MKHTEYECRVLNIDLDALVSKLESLDAENKGEKFQKRYVYDFNPVEKNAWIRLRTNGDKVTLTIKEIKDKNSISGTEELEIGVTDFEATNQILERLGYHHRNYQENKRWSFVLNGVKIDIDSWPLIPTYAEIEGSSESEVLDTLKLLDIDRDCITTLDVESIYQSYGIDLLKIEELKFDEGLLELNKSM